MIPGGRSLQRYTDTGTTQLAIDRISRPMLPQVVLYRSTLRRRSPKSLPLNSFADPHPLTPVPSILYKKYGGERD